MNITSIETAIRRIVAHVTSAELADVIHETPISGNDIATINNDACLALNINIQTSEAGKCRTVGDYIELVRSKR